MSRDHIQQRVSAYRQQLAAIRADDSLTPLGKRRAIEALHSTTKAEVEPLRRDLLKAAETSRSALERRLFGLPRDASPTDVLGYRDAQDRVARIRKPEELGELMERASVAGDHTLLRAAAHRAWQQGRNALASDHWDGLVQEYAQQTGMGDDLNAFAHASTPLGSTQAMAEQMTMSLPDPPELRGPEPAPSSGDAAA